MSWMVESIVDPDPRACPRCGGMGTMFDHTCVGGIEADAERDAKGKLVWTFKTKSGRVLSAARVERGVLRRQLRRTREAMREALPLWALEKKIVEKLAALKGEP